MAAVLITNTAMVSTSGDLNPTNDTASDTCRSVVPDGIPLLSFGGMVAAVLVLLGVAFGAFRRQRTSR
jgi:hypothetical protein